MEKELLGSLALEDAAECLYEAERVRHVTPLPDYESQDARDMRIDCRYRVMGAYKRGDHMARLAVVERVAMVLATANGDIWPGCDNRIDGRTPELRGVLAAKRRQKYRHQAQLICAEVARFYEIDLDTPEMLAHIVANAHAQRAADAKTVQAYESRVGRCEVVQIREHISER